MIKVITPVHKLIPWWNLRILGMCCQTHTDWEWVLLDNSENGFVQEYVDNFFDNLQGKEYPQCRERMRVFHEPFNGVKVSDGRVGKLKNRCVELAKPNDGDIVFTLDYDDFINTRTLELVAEAAERTDALLFKGDVVSSTMMYESSGEFRYHGNSELWCKHDRLPFFQRTDEYKRLYESDAAFREYADSHVQSNGYMVSQHCGIRYGDIFSLEYDSVRKKDLPITLFNDGFERFIGRYSVFRELGGFDGSHPCEDFPMCYKASTRYKVLHIPYVFHSIINITDDRGWTLNTSNTPEYECGFNDKEFIDLMGGLFMERYEKHGITPIEVEEYKTETL